MALAQEGFTRQALLHGRVRLILKKDTIYFDAWRLIGFIFGKRDFRHGDLLQFLRRISLDDFGRHAISRLRQMLSAASAKERQILFFTIAT